MKRNILYEYTIIPFLGPWGTLFDPADPKAQNLVQWIGSAGPGGREGPKKRDHRIFM